VKEVTEHKNRYTKIILRGKGNETTVRVPSHRCPRSDDSMCRYVRTPTASARRRGHWRCRRRCGRSGDWWESSGRCWRWWCRGGSHGLFLGSALWAVNRAHAGRTCDVDALCLPVNPKILPGEVFQITGCSPTKAEWDCKRSIEKRKKENGPLRPSNLFKAQAVVVCSRLTRRAVGHRCAHD
jgi:hypothetical protein